MARKHGTGGMRAPRDLADRMRGDGFKRETFTLPRDAARTKARELLARYPKEAYGTAIERWRQLADGRIEFTMTRLPSAD